MITVKSCRYPAVCNGCGGKANFFIKSAVFTMFLCEDCMKQHIRDCSKLLQPKHECSPQMIAEADCEGDIAKCGDACHKKKKETWIDYEV
jgi:hypothetical protein